jgi:hypothetical protein
MMDEGKTGGHRREKGDANPKARQYTHVLLLSSGHIGSVSAIRIPSFS